MKKWICLLLVLLSVAHVSGQTLDWFTNLKKLQQFPSTEKDVQKLFSSPKITYATSDDEIKVSKLKTKVVEYETADGKLHVYYSAGKCTSENLRGYDLEDGVILSYYFQVKNPVPISLLKLKPNKFKVSKSSDTAHRFFTDSEKGVVYTIFDGKLQRVDYDSLEADSLKCEK